MDNIRNYLLRGGAWAFGGKLATAFVGLLLMGLLARLLSPAEMGLYFLAFNLATFFSILGRGGLENTLLRFIAQANGLGQSARLRSILRKGGILVFAGAVLVALIVALLVPWLSVNLFHSEGLATITYFVAGWSALLTLQFVAGEVFRGFQEIKWAVLSGGLLAALISVLLLGLASWIGVILALSTVLVIVILAIAASNAFALFILRQKIKMFPQNASDEVSYDELLDHSWPLLINAVTLFLLSQSDLWLLSTFASEKEVAIYGAASRLVLLTAMSLAIVNAVVPPLIARMHALNDIARLERVLRTVATVSAIPALAVLTLFILFSETIMDLVYGEFYRTGAVVLLILCAGQVVNVLVGSCGYTLIMTGHRTTIMAITLFCAFMAVILGTIMLRAHGVIGLASVYAIATASQQIAMWLFARLLCGVWTHAGFAYFQPTALRSIFFRKE